eukprot:4016295-Alexandrium_andersonii.AAC.1
MPVHLRLLRPLPPAHGGLYSSAAQRSALVASACALPRPPLPSRGQPRGPAGLPWCPPCPPVMAAHSR